MEFNNKEIALTMVKTNGLRLKYVSNELKDDIDVVFEACKNSPFALKYTSDKFKNDKNFILGIIKENASLLKYVNEDFKNDKDFVINACKNNWQSLNFVPIEFRNNKDIILNAIRQDGSAFQFASDELKSNREFILEACKIDGWLLKFVKNEFKNDREIVFEACYKYSSSFDEASEELKKSSFGKDLLRALDSYTDDDLNNFKKKYFYYFRNSLENLNDNSLNLNKCLKAIDNNDLENHKIIDALCDRFREYAISSYYDLEKLKQNPLELLNILNSKDFKVEPLIYNNYIDKTI